jgi:hypothetical protein
MIMGRDIVVTKTISRAPDPPVRDEHGHSLVCYGCAHSIGIAPYPSGPSGERPCMFCVRNPRQVEDLAAVQARAPGFVSPRYDNVAVKDLPADQYIATDRLMRDLPNGVMSMKSFT